MEVIKKILNYENIKYLIAAAMAAAIAFSSCTKETEAPKAEQEEEFSREYGEPVVFGVSTSYENVPETKVKYSGDKFTVEGKNYERIDWIKNDRMDIFCTVSSNPNSQSAEYKVSEAPTINNHISQARVSPAVPGKTLTWGGDETHYFYGVYPSKESAASSLPGDNRIIEYTSSSTGVYLHTEIPRIQYSGGTPILIAYTAANKNDTSPVKLDFIPAVNTFDIKIKNGRPTSMLIKCVRLESRRNYISGEYKMNIRADGERDYEYSFSNPDGTMNIKKYHTVEHDFGLTGRILVAGGELLVRLYTIPIDIEDLSIVIEETNSNKTALELRYEAAPNNWIKFSKEKKYNFTNITIPEAPAAYTYKFENNGPADSLLFRPITMLYPKQDRSFPIDNPQFNIKSYKHSAQGIPLPSAYIAVPWSFGTQNHDAWLSENSEFNYNGGATGEPLVIRLKSLPGERGDNKHTIYYDTYVFPMLQKPKASDYDLSRAGGVCSGSRNTANCYRVDRQGTYRFPLIYGNCIKNNEINLSAFTHLEADNTLTTNFVDGAGNTINSDNYKITAPQSVELVWEDRHQLIKELKLIQDGGEHYVHFEIENNLTPGNALIAVKKNNIILWTWHIWCVPNIDDSLEPGKISPTPIGNRPDMGGYKAVSFDLDLFQMDIKGERLSIPVKRIASYSQESCLFYTYGRLTPTPPASGSYYIHNNERLTTLERCFTGEFLPSGARKNHSDFYASGSETLLGLTEAISSPNKIRKMEIPTNNSFWKNRYANSAYKTVYDPCPAGYRVPDISKILAYINTYPISTWPKYGQIKECLYISNELNILFEGFKEKTYFLSSSGEPWPAAATLEYAPIFPKKE